MAAKKTTAKKTSKKTKKTNKTLLVVESPAKARTINKYLGSSYIVEASVGHIKDLTKFRLGVDIENGFKPNYFTIKGKGDIIKRLKQLAGESKQVLIATDPDREGEAIAWHLAEEVKKKNDNVRRVLFNEITKQGVEKGIKDSIDINKDLFMAQQARRVMDRIIGYKVSPFLSRALISKTSTALSAGRVQSVALRLICEREKSIEDFVPIEYWNIMATFQPDKDKERRFKARLIAVDDNSFKNPEGTAKSKDNDEQKKIDKQLAKLNYIRNKSEADNLLAAIHNENYAIENVTSKEIKKNPLSPFTTSLLQQESSRRLGYSNKRTMQIAQKLYEGVNVGAHGSTGLITYMRTDSVRISSDAQDAAAQFIEKSFGKEYLPKEQRHFKSKNSNIQDAHEAIRPTSLELTPANMKSYLSQDELQLYTLIFNRFVASQMRSAILDQTTVTVKGGKYTFRASGSVIKFDGYLAVYEEYSEANGNGKAKDKLPQGLQSNLPLDLKNSDGVQSFTKAPPRFTESSIVKELDELGIGRPSTYAQIISTLIDREYVQLQKKSFQPSELGNYVNDVLVLNFPRLFNVDFTAKMESELDKIAFGEMKYENMLEDFYKPFQESLKHAEESGNIEDIPCDECGAPLVIRVSRRGRFFGCSNYPECTFTKPIPKGEMEAKNEPEKRELEIMPGVTCDNCGKEMVIRQGRYGRFLGCIDYPACKGLKQITTNVKCPKCSKGTLSEKYSPKSRKKFWGCSNYPDCDYLTNYEPIDKACTTCGHYYLEYRFRKVEDGFEKYINCPGCREHFEIEG